MKSSFACHSIYQEMKKLSTFELKSFLCNVETYLVFAKESVLEIIVFRKIICCASLKLCQDNAKKNKGKVCKRMLTLSGLRCGARAWHKKDSLISFDTCSVMCSRFSVFALFLVKLSRQKSNNITFSMNERCYWRWHKNWSNSACIFLSEFWRMFRLLHFDNHRDFAMKKLLNGNL